MRRAKTRNIIPFDPEIERTFRSQRKKKVLAMADGQWTAMHLEGLCTANCE